MLKSLFGELATEPSQPASPPPLKDGPESPFAATAVLDKVSSEINEQGVMIDRHWRELLVTGSPAAAIRQHLASTRADLGTAKHQITLIDPTDAWATAVIKALADAGGQPVERLQLRDALTLDTLAMIERTSLLRRDEDKLTLYHADVLTPGPGHAEIPVALMERSHLTTVIIGPLDLESIEALLVALHEASQLPSWRCPHLLFMLPPNATLFARKIAAVPWPELLQVQVIDEPLISVSAVWNAMLGVWNQVKQQPNWEQLSQPAPAEFGDFPIKVADIQAGSATTNGGMASPPLLTEALGAPPAARLGVDVSRGQQALHELQPLEGLLGCALVDIASGLVLARDRQHSQGNAGPSERRTAGVPDHQASLTATGGGLGAARPWGPSLILDLDIAGSAAALLLRTQHESAAAQGLGSVIEEVITTTPTRQQVLRTLACWPEICVLLLLELAHANLPLARYKLQEMDKALGAVQVTSPGGTAKVVGLMPSSVPE